MWVAKIRPVDPYCPVLYVGIGRALVVSVEDAWPYSDPQSALDAATEASMEGEIIDVEWRDDVTGSVLSNEP